MKEKTGTSVYKEIIQWVEAILLAVIIALLLRGFVFEPVYVEGSSMENTLYTGQRLIVYKLGYYFIPPKHGDIVVLQYQEGITSKIPFLKNLSIIKKALPSISEVDYIKRIIGVPGDKVEFIDGYVHVNGIKLEEKYTKEPGSTYRVEVDLPSIIPANHYLVLGDNRNNSRDSRMIGLIGFDRIKGKAILKIWPMDKFGGLYGNMKQNVNK